MNCRRITTTAFLGNVASVGVFLKVGFHLVKEQSDAVRLPEGRGGQLVGLHIMKWVQEDKEQDSESVEEG
jgi:RimJ/RimL family protein N-acetyltransferase